MLRWNAISKTILAVLAAVMILQSEATGATEANTPVSIELVLAIDTSYSVDDFEYALMMSGIANAFRMPEIINIIGQYNGVAVTLFQWSSVINQQNMIPWQLLNDPVSILSFADRIENVKRSPNDLFTGIGGAIDFGVRLIAENAFEGSQLKIDISGDGRNNFGPPPIVARQQAGDLGIVINGLPIITFPDNSLYNLETYYHEEIIRGSGAFIEIADDYDDFERAFLRKLQRELTTYVSQEVTTPLLPAQQARVQPAARSTR